LSPAQRVHCDARAEANMQVLKRIGARLAKVGYLIRATCWAAVLGVIELVQNERGRRILAVLGSRTAPDARPSRSPQRAAAQRR